MENSLVEFLFLVVVISGYAIIAVWHLQEMLGDGFYRQDLHRTKVILCILWPITLVLYCYHVWVCLYKGHKPEKYNEF